MSTRSLLRLLSACFSLASTVLVSAPVQAAPTDLAVQGWLSSAAGGPAADGNYPLGLALYDQAAGGTALYKELFLGVAVKGGVFAVNLGVGDVVLDSAVFAGGKALWVGVTVGADPELARVAIRRVPYASHALVAAQAADLACSGCIDSADLAKGAVTTDKIAAGAVGAAQVSFNWAGGDGPGGAATLALSANTAKVADAAKKADTAAFADEAAAAQSATKALQADTAGALACTGCVSLGALAADAKAAFVSSQGGTIAGKLTVGGGLELSGGTLSGARFEAIDVKTATCEPAQLGRVVVDSQSKKLHFCDGQGYRRLASCSGVCKTANATPCGVAIADDCGDVGLCNGNGTFCAGGQVCTAGGCKTLGASPETAALSCAALLKADATFAGKDGAYWIDPDGAVGADAPFQAWCNMTTEGGGWTQVLNLDTSDGHVMWWGNAKWTDASTHGDASKPFASDVKPWAWHKLGGGTEVMVMVHEQGLLRGYKVFAKNGNGTLASYLSGGDNTILGSSVKAQSINGIDVNERVVRLSTKLMANHCMGSGCTTGGGGSPDGDRIGSDEATPSDNKGGGLGNWHDMNYCCSGTLAGHQCNGQTIRTAAEAQADWAQCHSGLGGYYGSDTFQAGSNSCSNSNCNTANWAQWGGINYDYAIWVR